MKIAIVHLGFFYSGGGEKLVLEEMRGLRKLGHQVACFAPYVDRDRCFPDVPEMHEVQALLPPLPPWFPMRDPLSVLLACLLVPFYARRFAQYDVLYGANQPGPWIAFVLGKLLKKPYVVYLAQALRILHPRDIDRENGIRIREGDARFISIMQKLAGRLIDWTDRTSVKAASAVLTNGDHVSQWIEEVYGVETVTCSAGCHPLPPGDLEYADRWRGELMINGETVRKPFVLLTNRHSPAKRFEYALWATKSVLRQHPDVTLVITGQETEYTDMLRYLARGLNLDQHVHFTGLVSEDDLARLYGSASAYVYPSPEEDFGMGIVEAMASGTPVVAWRSGGPTVTVLHGETGFLIAPYDTDEFATRIADLLKSPDLVEAMGRAGNRRVWQKFSYEQHCMIVEAYLSKSLEGPLEGAWNNQPDVSGSARLEDSWPDSEGSSVHVRASTEAIDHY